MLKRLIVIYGLFLVAIIVLADSGHGVWFFTTLAQIPYGDKLGHFFLMGAMSFLLTLATDAERMNLWGKHFLRGAFWLTVIVTLEEFSQIWFSNRGFSLIDLAFDYLGIFAFALMGAAVSSRYQHFESSN
jgi:VanZ family protein